MEDIRHTKRAANTEEGRAEKLNKPGLSIHGHRGGLGLLWWERRASQCFALSLLAIAGDWTLSSLHAQNFEPATGASFKNAVQRLTSWNAKRPRGISFIAINAHFSIHWYSLSFLLLLSPLSIPPPSPPPRHTPANCDLRIWSILDTKLSFQMEKHKYHYSLWFALL